MLVVPTPLVEVMSSTSEMAPKWRSSGVATVAAITSGLAPGKRADTKIAGSTIPAGSGVMILYGSANRDERQFPNPDVFDVTRNPQEHLAFGFGIHYCIGAPLARLEARIAMDAFLRRFPRVSLRDQQREWIDSFVVRGPKSLPLELH